MCRKVTFVYVRNEIEVYVNYGLNQEYSKYPSASIINEDNFLTHIKNDLF
jgi:hypothetical protein